MWEAVKDINEELVNVTVPCRTAPPRGVRTAIRRRWQPKTVQVGAETILTTSRISLRDLKFATRGLYFQNDFVCDKEAQSCPVYFARHPAR
jgi:hypothetical protein